MIIIPHLIMMAAFFIWIVRWSLFIYYKFAGEEATGVVKHKKTTNIYVSNDSGRNSKYYRVFYGYMDSSGKCHTGRLNKLYRWEHYKSGDTLKIRYSIANPEESICYSLREMFTYEAVCFLASLILLFSIYFM